MKIEMQFAEIDIHDDLKKSALSAGFIELTSIQEECLVPALEGKDIAGVSQTGTGKTVAFLLPILNRIYRENLTGPAALIVTPTRELCVQISEEARKLSREHPVKVVAVYGGEGYRQQERELSEHPDIIVATPGRLIDYMKQKKLDVSGIRFLVLDEADRMFDMGFIRDIRYIMRHVGDDVQTMLFSATLSYYVMRLASDYMHDPVQVRIESETVAVDKITQKLYHLGRDEKLPYLINIIQREENIRAIVFTNLKTMVPFLVHQLQKYGIAATGISSLLDQKKRIRLLKDFKTGRNSILIATDVASRGIDVDDITHVFNYDLPQDAESYVHRIGRTARAGKTGISISFCSEMDYMNLPRIERYQGVKIEVSEVDSELLKFPPVADSSYGDNILEQTLEEGNSSQQKNGRTRKRKNHRRGNPNHRNRTPDNSSSEDGVLTVRELDRQALLNRMDGEVGSVDLEENRNYSEQQRHRASGSRRRRNNYNRNNDRNNHGDTASSENRSGDRNNDRNKRDRRGADSQETSEDAVSNSRYNQRRDRDERSNDDRNEQGRKRHGGYQGRHRGNRSRNNYKDRDRRNQDGRRRNNHREEPKKKGIVAKIISLFSRR